MISHDRKNLMRSTTDRPLRFALLGPHNSSKSSIVSIITSNKSLGNYYPTIQNSPTLLQFQPANPKTRTLLDINAAEADFEEMGIIGGTDINLTEPILSAVKKIRSRNTSTEHVLSKTLNYYDLDYTELDDKLFPISPYSSPLNYSSVSSPFSSPFEHSFEKQKVRSNSTNRSAYIPPYTTPILLELIDTPGVEAEELIPFLERSLDSRLAKDVLRNLAEDNDGGLGRARVKPLIVGSGISDLNGSIDGYILCYSCIPETTLDSPPPSYCVTDDPQDNQPLKPLEVVKAIKSTLEEAWTEYLRYHHNWEVGKEYDIFSINHSLKTLWNKSKIAQTDPNATYLPPIVMVATHCAHELASPVLVEEGRKLAKQWSFPFIEIDCSFENWTNVEECVGLMIRESIESQRAVGQSGALKKSKAPGAVKPKVHLA
ncbi:hypothetical protein KL947_001098 [Ogataea haglerorum]|nr:hypothetical protein KL947_001098 [Ogataea haglerorum]